MKSRVVFLLTRATGLEVAGVVWMMHEVAVISRQRQRQTGPITQRQSHGPRLLPQRSRDSRLIGVVFESPEGPYFIRFVGPAKTVGENEKAFKEMLKNFKK